MNMKCEYCGRRIGENYKFCPDCGAKLTVDVEVKTKGPEQVEEKDVEQSTQVDSGFQPKKKSGFSIAGFVLSLCPFLTGYLAIPCAILALVFSAIAISQCKKGTGCKYGLALAGLIIAIVILVAMLLYYLFFLVIKATWAGSNLPFNPSIWSTV